MRVDANNGANCGYEFEKGKNYIVWAYTPEALHVSTSECSRTSLVSEAADQIQWFAQAQN